MAKIYIVYSDDGKIIAASTSKNPARPVYGYDGKIMGLTGSKNPPERIHGVTVGEFEVPAKFRDRKMHEYLPLLVVDVRERRLKEE